MCAGDSMTLDLYTYFSDATLITEDLTEAFLEQLQLQLEASGYAATALGNLTEIVDTFQSVARDVLNYLRRHNSQTLLPLLRQFSAQGTVALSDVNPDVLQKEVHQLLNITQLATWFTEVSSRDHASHTTVPPSLSQVRV